jgi:hypothetical protein
MKFKNTNIQDKRLDAIEIYVKEKKYSATLTEQEKSGIRKISKNFQIIG